MSFTPFDPLPASDLNDIVENIEALADGSGLDAGAVGPTARTGGFWAKEQDLGSGSGSVSITGVPFAPRMVDILGPGESSASFTIGTSGKVMLRDDAAIFQATKANTGGSSDRASRYSIVSGIIRVSSGNTVLFAAQVTSFNSDGITLNKTVASAVAGERTFAFFFIG